MTSLRFKLTYKDNESEGLDWPTRMKSLRFRQTYKDEEPEV